MDSNKYQELAKTLFDDTFYYDENDFVSLIYNTKNTNITKNSNHTLNNT